MKRWRHIAALAALAALIATSGGVTYAAFVASTQNNGNTIGAGSVLLADNDGGAAVVSFAAGTPGTVHSGCIKVTYNGSLPASVRLFGNTTSGGLEGYLDLKVTRGVYTPSEPSFNSCTNFQADATNYIGAGSGVVYDGTLAGFPDNYATGLVDPTSGSPESWTTGEVHVYKVDVEVQDDIAAEGLSATQAFTWEARNQ